MFLPKYITTFRNYFILIFALILSIWIANIGGFIGLRAKGVIIDNIFLTSLYSFINNSFIGIIIGLIFFPLFYLLKKRSENLALIILGLIFGLILLIELSLIKYNLITLIFLGGDLLGYSFNDITHTATASNTYDLAFLWPFVVLPILIYFLFKLLQKILSEKIITTVVLVFSLLILILKFTISDVSARGNQNKLSFLVTDIFRVLREQNSNESFNEFAENSYPLLKPAEQTKDVLGPFFKENQQPPNIVFFIVEGLGRDFCGPDAEYAGFTPFLDSLQTKSLYWKNFVSTTGRTFGVMSSLLGSLPLGDEGFLEIKKTPTHISLISALKDLNYSTTYYTGGDSSFDRIVNFLNYEGTDLVVDQKNYGNNFTKAEVDEKGFSWGYPDEELYRKGLSVMEQQSKPSLSIFLTISSHEPFNFPGRPKYIEKVKEIANNNQFNSNHKNVILNNSEVFASIMYIDKTIQYFIKEYQKRPDFENTIFIITGDHRLIPIPQKDNLSRFHVPLIIYSPLLNRTKQFEAIGSHFDVTPSLVAFLQNRFGLGHLKNTAWMSAGLDTTATFRGTKEIPMMRYKGMINDFIYKDYFYSENVLYKIDNKFNINEVNDPKLEDEVKNAFQKSKNLNHYLVTKNKIYPDSLRTFKTQIIEFSKDEQKFIDGITKGKNPDEQFMIARNLAFNEKRDQALLLCNYILNEYPNFVDTRLLKGRILAWNKKYDEAEIEFLRVIKQAPYYADAYSAILDLYWWSNQENKSLKLIKKEVMVNMANPEISFKLAKANFRMNNSDRAKVILDSIIKKYPNNQDFKDFRKTIK